VRYTDATFSTRWAPPTGDEAARWAHLALLGPLIRGEVGDTLRVWFRNAAPAPFSVHPHGVVYSKGGEGAPYVDATADARDTGDDSVKPGETWPYTWFLPEASGPAPGDPSAVPWLYHGHVHEAGDENTGLLGVLLVTGKGRALVPGSALEADLRPKDVDRELVVMAKVFSEGMASSEVHEEGRLSHHHHQHREVDDFTTFFTLNGLIGCRLRLAAEAGERVRVYGVSLGNEIDLHTLGVSGHALNFRGKRQSGLQLIPGTMYAADTVAVGGGGWLLGSSVVSHAEKGMVARFDVSGDAAPPPPAAATVRSYFIAAVEVDWDYAPAGSDRCVSEDFKAAAPGEFPELSGAARFSPDGTDLQGFSDPVRTFVERVIGDTASDAALRIGRRYRKARYLGFTDATFRWPLLDAHGTSTGILGPALRAAAGEVLRIVLRNNLTFAANLAFPAAPLQLASLRERPIGAAKWGAPLAGLSPAELAARPVAPGWEVEASWTVPASAGPGASDTPTIAWAYTSDVSPDHLYAGLAGGLVVAASPAALTPGSKAHGAAREYLVAWFISNENRSPYLAENVAGAVAGKQGLSADDFAAALAELTSDESFDESNLKHAVSGRLACNLDGLVATRGERVRLHFLGLGAELDMHTPQTHGYLAGGAGGQAASYAAAVSVHPGTRSTVDLQTTVGGKWMLECGVNDHWAAGMRALLTVTEPTAV
jgi:hephaestin